MINHKRNALIGLALILLGLSTCQVWKGPDRRPIILSQVQALSDLVTVKYVTEQIVKAEDGNFLSKDKIVLIAHGVIKAGIDLNDVTQEDIRVTGKTISLHLPHPQIVDKYLDEKLTQVSTRDTGWFVFHRKDLESEARQKALADLVTASQAEHIQREAETQAKTLIAQFFKALGYDQVEYF